MSVDKKLEELNRRNRLAELGGGEERIKKRHAEGKLTARERVNLLLDEGQRQTASDARIAPEEDQGVAFADHACLHVPACPEPEGL